MLSEEKSLGNVEVSLTPLQRFEEYLQSKNLRNTEPRRLLVEHVFTRHEHFDADTLIEELPRKGEVGYVGRATVYRALTELVEAGLLRKFSVEGRTVYEHDYGYPAHDHLYCSECKKLIEFQNEQLTEIRNALAREHRFRVTGHKFIVTGVCYDCSRAKSRVHRKLDRI
ncbi:Fur family transcriptional regulator [Lignipirellula cremea]|uniref:Ferric uptake regulation protein n=1 Tax=Lignipirellula cremea TaxID=2528010 RepID=A0A518E4Y5_9BACT|nr:Fur family transcriptional regulator [Lignipirellula cremea]QDU99155.1 Ferric uptake regulation protein [Lignipirellula cremea]